MIQPRQYNFPGGTMFAKIKPIITFVLTQILLAFLISVAAYFILEQKEIKPRYAISAPEMLAEANTGTPRLKLLWDNEEIQNVYSLKIAIWNAGREYLDKSSISTTDPIKVTYPPDVEILYADFIRTSRDNLSFTATDLSDEGTNAIQIQIVGDEALEQKDGGVLKILYAGHTSDGFAVTGRIKGSKQGFKEVSWPSFSQKTSWTLIIIIVFLTPICPIYIISAVKKLRDDELKKKFFALFDIAFAIYFLVLEIYILFIFVKSWSLKLQWII